MRQRKLNVSSGLLSSLAKRGIDAPSRAELIVQEAITRVELSKPVETKHLSDAPAEVPVPTDYREWLLKLFPRTYLKPLAPFHHQFWQDIWSLTPDQSQAFIYVWPRGFSKTTNAERAVIRLAAAGFRYVLYVKETQDQADDAVQNIAAILESPEVGVHYPLLGDRLIGKYGTSKGWRRNRLRTASGLVVDAAGLDTAVRGLLIEGARPDVIFLDDLDAKHDSIKKTEKKIKILTSDIIPAGAPNRVIIGLQNIINPHGIFTRLAELNPEFPLEFLFNRVLRGPYPAVDGLEFEMYFDEQEQRHLYRITAGTSTWPEGRPINVLEGELNELGPTAFIEEKQNEVPQAKGSLYKNFEFRLVPYPALADLEDIWVVVDPAVTSHDNSDCQAISAAGRRPNGTVVTLYAWEGIESPDAIMERALLKAVELRASTVAFETNQGGDTWETVYRSAWENLIKKGLVSIGTRRPRFHQMKASASTGGKRERWQVALGRRERGEVEDATGTHLTRMKALRRLPEHKPYDLADVDYWSIELLIKPKRQNIHV